MTDGSRFRPYVVEPGAELLPMVYDSDEDPEEYARVLAIQSLDEDNTIPVVALPGVISPPLDDLADGELLPIVYDSDEDLEEYAKYLGLQSPAADPSGGNAIPDDAENARPLNAEADDAADEYADANEDVQLLVDEDSSDDEDYSDEGHDEVMGFDFEREETKAAARAAAEDPPAVDQPLVNEPAGIDTRL